MGFRRCRKRLRAERFSLAINAHAAGRPMTIIIAAYSLLHPGRGRNGVATTATVQFVAFFVPTRQSRLRDDDMLSNRPIPISCRASSEKAPVAPAVLHIALTAWHNAG